MEICIYWDNWVRKEFAAKPACRRQGYFQIYTAMVRQIDHCVKLADH